MAISLLSCILVVAKSLASALNSQSPDIEYLAVDVYTRFPLTHRIIDCFAKKIKKSKNCKGFPFARAETRAGLKDEHLGGWKDNFRIFLLEYVRTSFLKSINVHEIEKKVVALSEASWYEVARAKEPRILTRKISV